jgi:hypothetical protein
MGSAWEAMQRCDDANFAHSIRPRTAFTPNGHLAHRRIFFGGCCPLVNTHHVKRS